MNILDEVIGLVSEKITVLETVGTMIKLETRLLGLSIIPCLWSIGLLLFVVGGMWLLLQALLTYSFIVLINNIPLGIGLTLVFNVFVFFGLLYYLRYNLKNMSFEKTRAYLSRTEKSCDESYQKKIETRDSNDGKEITMASGESNLS